MSSINTSNALGFQSTYPVGKQPVDPNRNPLSAAPNHGSNDDTESPAAARQDALPTPREAKALDTAQKLVATTLIKPILAQARATRDAPAPWNQTQAEKQFGALLDNRLADDISKASNFAIAKRIADQILKNSSIIDIQQTNPQSPPQYAPTDIFG